MKAIPGRVENGVIVVENGFQLPEGAAVTILCDPLPPRARPATSWDEIFATMLVIGSGQAQNKDDELKVTGDDFLF